jgi:SAM-dependent methyltransferase
LSSPIRDVHPSGLHRRTRYPGLLCVAVGAVCDLGTLRGRSKSREIDGMAPPEARPEIGRGDEGRCLNISLREIRERVFREKVLRLARLQPGEAVLDVGCGTGTLAIAAKRQVGPTGTVYGIDASPEMLARAEKKARKAGVEVVLKNAMAQASVDTQNRPVVDT